MCVVVCVVGVVGVVGVVVAVGVVAVGGVVGVVEVVVVVGVDVVGVDELALKLERLCWWSGCWSCCCTCSAQVTGPLEIDQPASKTTQSCTLESHTSTRPIHHKPQTQPKRDKQML